MNRIAILLCILLTSLNIRVEGQRHELGVFLGTSYYLGELNPGEQFLMNRPSLGFIYRYNLSPRFAYKLNVYYGMLEGADSVSGANRERNLSFRSPLLELSNQIELNFMQYVPGNKDYAFTPYLFGGFTVFYYDPQAKYNGEWYNLSPLGTEGQGTSANPGQRKYARTNFAFPFGAGLKYNLTRGISLGIEWGLRKTFTDYLDDISTTYADPIVIMRESGTIASALSDRSEGRRIGETTNTGLQRGNSKNKDWYSFAGIIITIKIKNRSEGCEIYKKRFNYRIAKLYDQRR